MSKKFNTQSVKRKVPASQDESLGHKWTDVDQHRLEFLLFEDLLKVTDSSSKVKELDESFEKFSNNVIGYHMGLLRKKKLLRKASSGNGPVNEVLSQFGVVAPLTGSRSEGDASDMMNASEESSNDALICSNMPYVRFNYMDYASKKEKVVIFVDLPGGSGDYKWEFNDAGDSITLLVDWSKSLYDVTHLFKADLRKNEITMDHPKLHAIQSELLKQGISSKQIPKFSIQIPLGKKVHKDDDTWDVTLMKHDGNKILTIEFSGFQEELLKKVKAGTFQ